MAITLGAFAVTGCTSSVRFGGGTVLTSSVVTPAKAAEAPVKRAKVANGHIEIDEKVQFATNSDAILPASDPLLDDIVDAFKENPQIKKVEIQGHASSEGDANRNKTLSNLRAKAVMAALAAKGVEPSRMTAKGYGIEKPIADNKTEEGREKNRRVEFLIIDPAPSAEAAAKN
ncbi:MAG: hypothetical protein BGO98_18630 [Myxococcales bacterium 68-20]|nr:MAG: hypothetical protein BGO98_18630 [Myxococcales bacterium 68-20]